MYLSVFFFFFCIFYIYKLYTLKMLRFPVKRIKNTDWMSDEKGQGVGFINILNLFYINIINYYYYFFFLFFSFFLFIETGRLRTPPFPRDWPISQKYHHCDIPIISRYYTESMWTDIIIILSRSKTRKNNIITILYNVYKYCCYNIRVINITRLWKYYHFIYYT